MKSLPYALRALLVALLVTGAAAVPPVVWSQTAAAPARPRIEKAADLPRFTYRISGKVEDLARHADRFAPFAAALRKDIEGVLERYEIPDRATQRELMTSLALLDFLDGRYEQALARAEQVRALQDKPADKLISGLRLRAAARAAQAHGVGNDSHRRAVAEFIATELAAAPQAVIDNEVRELKASSDVISESLVIGRLREVLQPIVDKSGALSSEFAPSLVAARYALQVTLPLKTTYAEAFGTYLAAHKVTKTDIWAARDVTLTPSQGRPVNVAVWDSGVDTALFADRMLRDAKGQPLVIAYDKHSRPSKGPLMPLASESQRRLPTLLAYTKGLSDLQSTIDSPEATEVKRYLSQLPPDRYRTAMEELGLVGNYTHGTHVAGITMAGNPQARLMVARIEFSHSLKPDPCPSIEQARRDAAASAAYVDFFKRHDARVVNMSWGGSINDTEVELEQCGIGKTPDERKRLARQIFEISRKALTEAIASAPGILFVAAAGNSADDATYTENIPAGIDLPNLLSVGAVDLAGEEAPFTSYGPTVRAHANGYQVVSVVPGGQRIALSGTSMAAPQVANLAAKMLAVNPALTPVQLVERIVGTADKSADGRRVLVHPRKALDQAIAAR